MTLEVQYFVRSSHPLPINSGHSCLQRRNKVCRVQIQLHSHLQTAWSTQQSQKQAQLPVSPEGLKSSSRRSFSCTGTALLPCKMSTQHNRGFVDGPSSTKPNPDRAMLSKALTSPTATARTQKVTSITSSLERTAGCPTPGQTLRLMEGPPWPSDSAPGRGDLNQEMRATP